MSLSKEDIEDYLKKYLSTYSYSSLKQQMLNHGAELRDIEEVYFNLNSNIKSNQKFNSIPEITNNLTNVNLHENESRNESEKKPLKIHPYKVMLNIILFSLTALVCVIAILGFLFPEIAMGYVLQEKGEFSGYFELDTRSTFDNITKEVTVILNPLSKQSFYIYEKDSKNLLTLQEGEVCKLNELIRVDKDLLKTYDDISFDNIQIDENNLELQATPIAIVENNLVQLTFHCPQNLELKKHISTRLHLNLYDLESKEELYVQNSHAFIKN